ncbi:CitB family two-component system response regulator CitT [Alkalihalobacillus xiaoxiensis]|uniref:CitB family two-component system response regulator CitT n=1 Tax=Shouchella xiaoxiensis TaxID=766895 RepID=A0ABS2SUV7_9BACI|nr:response regulator [Shouchella xiaoxiensis]MBM7838966.1 CitB family two-component system response regulator CitT [Shouchella xiaoxiensis]
MKIMIAEDDFRVADIHEQFLQQIDQVKVVAKARDAKETLLFARQYQPDLLLLDVYLPDQLGVDLLASLHAQLPSMQVILITAATEKDVFVKALQQGVTDYLVKPITLARLKLAIEKAVTLKEWVNNQDPITQTIADQFFQSKVEATSHTIDLPKGIDQLTLKKVQALLKEQTEGETAEAIGKKFGASRTTSRRYLEYLISVGQAKAQLEYGIVGRPERKYWPV